MRQGGCLPGRSPHEAVAIDYANHHARAARVITFSELHALGSACKSVDSSAKVFRQHATRNDWDHAPTLSRGAGCAEAEALIDEVLDQADCLEHTVPGLCRHTYARHVMMAIALHGPARHRERVTRALRAEGVALPTYSSLSSSTSLSVHVRGVWRRTRRRKWKPCLIVEKR